MRTIDLSGKVALVTGASRGIGLATAKRLREAGASVVLTARSFSGDFRAEFDAVAGADYTMIEGSLDSADFARALVRQVFASYKRLDILVNNAGIMKTGMIGMISDADIDETLNINLASVVHLTQAVGRLMGRTGGSIVNLTSIVGRFGTKGQLVYAASKAGVIGATLSASKELAPKNIRVNAVAPGFITTDMTRDLGDAVAGETIARIGLGRAGTPEDVADTILFLGSDLSRYVTGQVIGVDGGMVL